LKHQKNTIYAYCYLAQVEQKFKDDIVAIKVALKEEKNQSFCRFKFDIKQEGIKAQNTN